MEYGIWKVEGRSMKYKFSIYNFQFSLIDSNLNVSNIGSLKIDCKIENWKLIIRF